MNYYTQLKERERMHIFNGVKQGMTITRIAQQIGRNKSTVSRELTRNKDLIGYLYPRDAQRHTDDRKARHGSKIDRNPLLKEYVMKKIQEKWSPVIIAGRWSRENQKQPICAETIYRFAYHPKNKALGLWKLFPKAKRKRGVMRKQRSTGGIMHRVSIHNRPAKIDTREDLGHYEADLMFNAGSQSANVLTLIERKSRVVTFVKHTSKHSQPIIESIKDKIGPRALSCTFDNGKEFALHHTLNIPTFFCDPGSPWQKGSVENANGLARAYIPFSMNSHSINQEYLDQIAHDMNNKPRKIFKFLTPYEVFNLSQESRVKFASPATEVSFQSEIK